MKGIFVDHTKKLVLVGSRLAVLFAETVAEGMSKFESFGHVHDSQVPWYTKKLAQEHADYVVQQVEDWVDVQQFYSNQI